MIEEHFGFSAQPFKLSPDTKFFFSSSSHTKAMAYLHYGLRQAEGFIVITGEIGTGKSMLIGHMLDQINSTSVSAAHIVTSTVEPDQLLSQVLSAFQIEAAGTGRAAELEAFEDFLYDNVNRGRRVLLVVDEAQNLPSRTIEELRMLTNINHQGTPLFQVFLVGQPEFRDTLGRADMEQLRQRVIASYHLHSLNSEETREYIEHRLAVVGRVEKPYFTEEAFDLIFDQTGGVPRRINSLCTRLLLFCALEDRDLINSAVVRKVADELSLEVSGAVTTSHHIAHADNDEDLSALDKVPSTPQTPASNVVTLAPNGAAYTNGVDASQTQSEKPNRQSAATLNDVASAIAALAKEQAAAKSDDQQIGMAHDEPVHNAPTKQDDAPEETIKSAPSDMPSDAPISSDKKSSRPSSSDLSSTVMDHIMALRGDLHAAHKGNRTIYQSLAEMEDNHADNVVQIREHLDRADGILRDLKR